MDVYEITDYKTGESEKGVNYLQPSDTFQKLEDGFIYRQVLQSRKGIGYYCPRLAGGTRITGIFDFRKPDGTFELLATDKNYLYRYNETTNVFDQISFAGSMAGYAGFNILDNEDYISGVGYATKTNTARFVFSSSGIQTNASGSAVFFYNGTDVRDFTNVADNADYAQPLDGKLVRAKHIFYFNERINFVVPSIVTARNQGVLYSGIKDSAGNGEKFNVSGSGLLQFSTYESIKGASILGQDLLINLEKSAKVLEITADVFNPYRIRNIPSVLGSDASFSSVAWNNIVNSVGKTGILQTDARSSLRVDNKLPNFAAERIDQQYFELTYGGFDRANGQFLWSYKEDNLSSDDTQDRVLVRNYEEDSWSVYKMRLTCFGATEAGQSLAWNQIEAASGNPSWDRWDTTEESWKTIGLGKYVSKTLAGDDLGFIYQLNSDADDNLTSISAISQASQAVCTVGASSFLEGDSVIVENVTGMTEINNFDPSDSDQTDIVPYTVVSATPTSVTLNVDSSLFTAYTSGGKLSKLIEFYGETIPFNPYIKQGKKIFISHVEFLVPTDIGYFKVDLYENEENTPIIRDFLLKPSSTLRKTEWLSMVVNNEAEFMRFAIKHVNPGSIFKQTSMRIYAEAGGDING